MGGPGPDPDPINPRPPGAKYEPKYEIAVVEITEACNLRCLHCYNRRRVDRFLSLSDGLSMARTLQSLGMKYVIFSGGEPLIHRQFFDLVDSFNQHDLPIIMRSNAQLINASVADEIAARNFHFIGISIDGGTRNTNDLIRGQGTYNRAIDAARMLKERGLAVTIEVTLTSLSVTEIPEIVAMAEDVMANLVIFRRLIPLGTGNGQKRLCATGKDLSQAKRAILDLVGHSKINFEIGCNLGGTCLAYDYFAIDLNGWVHPCYMIRKPLFHISQIEGNSKIKLESFAGKNVHECLRVLRKSRDSA